jgi:hypothetical protein
MNRAYEEEAQALIDAYLDGGGTVLTCNRAVLVEEIVNVLVSAQNDAYDLIDDNSRLADDESETQAGERRDNLC